MHFQQDWQIGSLDFRLVQGDLFEARVDAIVNSEQTDFILSGDVSSISGQIRERFGLLIQDELDAQTLRRTLPPGTVLRTGGGGDYRYIYHAGFHHPLISLDPNEENSQTEHIQTIRSCVHDILAELETDNVNSVAFPLLGCGIFGLNPALLAYEFIDELVEFATRNSHKSKKEVHLIVDKGLLLNCVLHALVQSLMNRSCPKPMFSSLELGIDYLQRFEAKKVVLCRDREQLAWRVVQYCELILNFAFFQLAAGARPSRDPETTLEEDKPVCFGTTRSEAETLAKGILTDGLPGEWPRFMQRLILRDLQEGRRLKRINEDRNDIAHGRAFRDVEAILRDVTDFARPPTWQALLHEAGPPDLDCLRPWIARHPASLSQEVATSEIGVLERWKKKAWKYLIPHSGETFTIKR